jgi:glutathione S-transferase
VKVETPKVFGAAYSVYVRAARLALEEKGVAYDLVEIDVFGLAGAPADHLARQPFGRIPAFEHGDFHLYETAAITRYVDEAFGGPALQPQTPRLRARMAQVISILDSYAYRTLVRDFYVGSLNRARVEAAIPSARVCLRALDDARGDGPWFAGSTLSLADLHAAPMFAYFLLAEEAAALMSPHPGLAVWWDRIRERGAMMRTRPQLGHPRLAEIA